MPLDLPEPDHTTLARAPLVSVIAQVQFEEQTTASDPKVASRFHDLLGGTTGPYPSIQELRGQGRLTVTLGPTGPVSETQTSQGWRLASKDNMWAATLFPHSVGLETTKYVDWEDFSGRLRSILDAVVATIPVTFEQRVGLRFVDRIQTGASTPAELESAVSKHLLGPMLHPGLGAAVQSAQQALQLDLGDDCFCGMRQALVPMQPPDGGGSPTYEYFLDFDLYREGGRPFDVEGIAELFTTFDHQAVQLFQASLNPEFLEQLR